MTKLTNAVELIEQLRQHDAGISRSGVSVTIFSEAANRIEEQDQLREKLADLLTRIAAALKGEPEPNTLHSWHNLPELARAATERAQAAEQAIREHNDGLQEACDAMAARGYCDAYRARGMTCTDCPREWVIDAALAAPQGEP